MTGPDQSRDGPDSPTPETRVFNAEMMGKSIRLIDDDGREIDCVSVSATLTGQWAVWPADHDHATLRGRETVVRLVRAAHPMVYTIPVEWSAWGDEEWETPVDDAGAVERGDVEDA